MVVEGDLRWLRGFSPVDLTEKMLFSLLEELIGKLPSVWYNLSKTVGVELAHEAGEIVVLEVVGEEVAGELGGTPDHESGVVFAPRDDVVGCWVIDQLVSFG